MLCWHMNNQVYQLFPTTNIHQNAVSYTLLSLVLNVLTVHFKQVLLVQTGALSSNSCSAQSCGAASNLLFYTLQCTFPNFDLQLHTFVCIVVVCSLLYWALSCRFPLGGGSESQPAASAVLPQCLYSTSTCGSADRLDKVMKGTVRYKE